MVFHLHCWIRLSWHWLRFKINITGQKNCFFDSDFEPQCQLLPYSAMKTEIPWQLFIGWIWKAKFLSDSNLPSTDIHFFAKRKKYIITEIEQIAPCFVLWSPWQRITRLQLLLNKPITARSIKPKANDSATAPDFKIFNDWTSISLSFRRLRMA